MISFELAQHEDDAAIRRLLATTPMPGRIRLRFEREPDYFAGCASMGPFTQVLVAKDGDRVVGVACRAVRSLYVNGVPEDVGYLGHLRVDPAYRGQLLVARGFQKLRELHGDGRAKTYVTTIIEGNEQAEGVLVRSPRSTMPQYSYLSKLFTLAIPVGKSRESSTHQPGDLTEARRAFASLGPARNLFPADDPHGEVVTVEGGAAALVDQRACKQTVVDGYDRMTALMRPLYNLVAPIKLPKPGTALAHACVTHFCVANDDAGTAKTLIDRVLDRARKKGLDHILLAFTARDPLLEVARRFKPVEYASDIYTVSWDHEDQLHDRLDSRPRTLDISAL